MQTHTDDPEARYVPGVTYETQAAAGSGVPRSLTLRSARLHQQTWLLGFEEIPDRTGAESLRGTRLFIDAEAVVADDEDDAWYEDELVGLTAVDPAGAALGEVTGLRTGAAPDQLVLRLPDGTRRPSCRSSRRSCPRSTSRAVASSSTPRPGSSSSTPTDGRLPVIIDVVSIFPEYLAPLDLSLIGKAHRDGLLDVRVHDLREFAHDRHRSVDDTPYGGGAGMVMKPQPWAEALDHVVAAGAEGARPRLVVPGPGGMPFTQAVARELADEPWLAFACGRYEGIDERVYEYAAQATSGSRCRSSRSATTSSTGERWRCWRWSRPSPGCCPASSATPSRSSRSPTRTVCSSTPSTPSPPPGSPPAVPPGRFPPSCCPVTTAPSRPGATSSGSTARPPVAPTCCTPPRRRTVWMTWTWPSRPLPTPRS